MFDSFIFHILRKYNRFSNQLHRYDYPDISNGWKKFGNAPALGSVETGTMFDPYAYKEDNLIKMVVSARKDKALILVESEDGVHWSNRQTILDRNSNQWDDVVNRGCVVKHNDIYMLWYTGQHNESASIGCAMSKDGIHYERYLKNPVMIPTEKYEGQSVMNPCVLWNEDKQQFQMWYAAGENYEPDVICYAESEDGIHWNKFDKPVLEKYSEHRWEQAKVGGCQVLKEKDGSYTIYYIGYQNIDVARICIAHSKDGIHWERDKNNLLIGPTKGSWDADATYKPTVVRMGGKTYMWYNGRTKNSEYIGLAIK